jgi:SPFH domain / Band 7 family
MAGVFGFRIIRQYEQGVVFRFGQALPGVRKPGLIWINPLTSRLTKVNMQIAVVGVPAQETITRDNVTRRPPGLRRPPHCRHRPQPYPAASQPAQPRSHN